MSDSRYMQRKKFFIPKEEIIKDYRDGHEKYPGNFLFKCDWDEVNEDDEDSITS